MDLYNLPLHSLVGIGERKSEMLTSLGIASVGDLLDYFPYRYEDYRLRSLSEIADGDKATIAAQVSAAPRLQRYGRNKSRLTCHVIADNVLITAVWFNRAFLQSRLQPGITVYLTGKWDRRRRQFTVATSEFGQSGSNGRVNTLESVYSVSGEVTQPLLRQSMRQAFKQFGDKIPENLPHFLVEKYRLMPRAAALRHIHIPGDVKQLQAARRRFKYEELFLFQLKLQAYRMLTRSRQKGIARTFNMEKVRQFIRGFPFTLTNSQKQVCREILSDLRASHSMNRLLQGDVGSGKTAVAAVALYANYLSGYQGALMVPTEILAEQHTESLQQLFSKLGIEVGLLTGSQTAKGKREMAASLQMGLTDIAVGTHALIQESVHFRNLGLVVTDEQHRFGVEQRSMLRNKGLDPDILTMTATPIPRTLALTAFGDMDVSTLKELPSGRRPVETHWLRSDQLEQMIVFLQREIESGRQGYVICPLIEESDKLDVQNAVELYEQLQVYFQDYKIGLLHGRMTASEKEGVMREFTNNDVHILVSTTVVEVGVNVPNASVMVIYDADRFGLSQLHQLRGRVGRASHQSYCILIADPKTEIGRERLEAMTRTNDGFEVARLDMELRGPGDYFGTKQSGVPEFKVADLQSDFTILEIAREDAASLVQRKDFHTAAELALLRHELARSGVMDTGILD